MSGEGQNPREPGGEALQPTPNGSGGPGGGPVPGPRRRGCIGSLTALFSVLVGAIYVINPGAGFIEFLPDNAPLFGNLDEAAATTMLVLGLQYLFGRGRQD